jgi:hypothetical protein
MLFQDIHFFYGWLSNRNSQLKINFIGLVYIVRNENDPMVDEIDVAPTAPHTLSFLSKLELGDS